MALKISVDYYNDREKNLFESYSNYSDIQGFLRSDFTISEDEFVSYMMFTEQDDEDGWRTYSDLKDRVQYRLGDIRDILDFTQGSIQSKQSAQRLNASKITERIGVSLGINVINKFHGLTEADWAITPDIYINGKRVKDFDYECQLASDGIKFIQVENKGSVNEDNAYKTSSVSQHYSDIKAKKSSLLNRQQSYSSSGYTNINYGTIGVLDDKNMARVWLVDPPAFDVNWDPRKFKLIARLIYYSKVFDEIGIHKRIQIALYERIGELIEAKDIEVYNNKPLERVVGLRTYIGNNNFAKINNTEAYGSFFFIDSKEGTEVFLIALTKKIISLVLMQNFEGILNYEYNNAELSGSVIIELSAKIKKVTKELDFTNTKFVFDEKRNKFFYQAYQKLRNTSSGRIFGQIQLSKG